jgi:phospholipid/cholesterol/gamma-HCH transport system substrate-binding protein
VSSGHSFGERRPKVIGGVAVVVIMALVGAVLVLNGSIFQSTYQVNARFPNAVGIGPGADVLLAGVDVGSVGSEQVQGNSVILTLDIHQGVVLPSDTSAKIEVQTLLGVTGVVLETGQDWSQPLKPGSLITDTTAPVEFFEVRSAATGLLSATDAKALGDLVQSLAQVTAGKHTEIAQIVSGLDKFTGSINARKQQLSELIDAAEQLSATLVSRDKELTSVVDDLDTVVSGLASHSSALGQLIDNTELAAQQTSQLVGRNQPKLQQMLDALHSDLAVLGQHQVDLAQSVAYAGAAVQGFQSVGYSGAGFTPNSWANIFVNLASITGVEGVLGSCGALDQALDVALGPDPLPCNARTGPIPTPAQQGAANSATTGKAG